MAEFCSLCGTQLSEEATVCPCCGAATSISGGTAVAVKAPVLPEAAREPVPVTASGKSGKVGKATYIGIGIVAVIVILIIALIAKLLSGGGYKKPLDNMLKGIKEQDADTYFSAYPEFF
ncbi:MAG: hypothetical protein WC900_03370, partial [Oscillospiraceae bacterium]